MSNKEYTTPLKGEYKTKIEGVIKIKYKDTVKLNICKITYELHYDGNYQYIFEPYYDILDALPSDLSQGIPGINLDKRKKLYYRVNRVPSFISERTMNEERENLNEELDKVCMKEYNPLEWLIRTDSEYSGDNLIVERYRLPRKLTNINYDDLMYGDVLESLDNIDEDVEKRGNQLLALIGSGVNIENKKLNINSVNRGGALQLLINEYETANKKSTSAKKVEEKETKKESKNKIDDFVMEEVIKELELKIISEAEAMNILNIRTRSTLYRKIRLYKLSKAIHIIK